MKIVFNIKGVGVMFQKQPALEKQQPAQQILAHNLSSPVIMFIQRCSKMNKFVA